MDVKELEEMAADMTLWVAGSEDGLVAAQMTSSVPSTPLHVVEAALSRARTAQLDSLASMRTNLSQVHSFPFSCLS